MSKIDLLRDALVKLEEAEEALYKVREAFTMSFTYRRLDGQFEVIGDAATIVRDILSLEEKKLMDEIMSELVDEEGALCNICDKPFTEQEWEDRHTDPNDGISDCHALCCPKCNQKR